MQLRIMTVLKKDGNDGEKDIDDILHYVSINERNFKAFLENSHKDLYSKRYFATF